MEIESISKKKRKKKIFVKILLKNVISMSFVIIVKEEISSDLDIFVQNVIIIIYVKNVTQMIFILMIKNILSLELKNL